jgi:hypothetical protein
MTLYREYLPDGTIKESTIDDPLGPVTPDTWGLWAALLISPTYNRVLATSISYTVVGIPVSLMGDALQAIPNLPAEQGIPALNAALAILAQTLDAVGQPFSTEERQEVRELLDMYGFNSVAWSLK